MRVKSKLMAYSNIQVDSEQKAVNLNALLVDLEVFIVGYVIL